MANKVTNIPQSMQPGYGGVGLAAASDIGNCIDQRIGTGTQDALTASTTQTQAGGTKITAAFTNVGTANASDAITFPQATPGRELVIVNSSGQTITVFPAVGDAINAAGA